MTAVPALVLAAGLSRRMGRFKLTLPWSERIVPSVRDAVPLVRDNVPSARGTVIGQVVATLEAAGVAEIVVVLGHRAEEVALVLDGTSVRTVFNANYADGEMLSSIQAGIPTLGEEAPALLLCLGDQPQMKVGTVRAIIEAGEAAGWNKIIVPSYQMHAGHPILLPAWAWPEILKCEGTLRDVMAAHREQTTYVTVETASILADLDTPADYFDTGRS